MYHYSKISTKSNDRGDVVTETLGDDRNLDLFIETGRGGREGTEVVVGHPESTNRRLRLNGRQARSLFTALSKHFDEVDYNRQ